MPDEFSRQLASKETLADAMMLKLFITGRAPNMQLFDRIVKLITKMFHKNPDEILRSGEEIWMSVISMILKLM